MAEESMVDGGSQDGYSVPITAEADEASFQAANRNIGGLEKSLKSLSSIDLSSLSSSIKTLAAGFVGVVNFTVNTNFDEVQNLLKAAKAGLSNEDFKRWSSVEVQLGLSKGSLTKDLADIYEQMAKIKTIGDLNKDQFLALGLTGAGAKTFINEKDMTKRVMTVMELALKSDRPPNETAFLLKESLGSAFSDLYYYLSLTGKSIEELFGKMTVFTNAKTQSAAVNFASEYGAAKSSIEEMGRVLAATLGEIMTTFLKQFNDWLKDYKSILMDILTFNDGWFTKAARLLAGVPQYSIFTDRNMIWEFPWGSSKVKTPTNTTSAGVENSIKQYSAAINLLKARAALPAKHPDYRKPLTYKDFDSSITGTLARVPFLNKATFEEQTVATEKELIELNKMRLATFVNEKLQPLSYISSTNESYIGYSKDQDYSKITPQSLGHAERENVGFDFQLAYALERFLAKATKAEVDLLLTQFKGIETRAIPVENIPQLEKKLDKGQKLFLQEDLNFLLDFLYKYLRKEETSYNVTPNKIKEQVSLVEKEFINNPIIDNILERSFNSAINNVIQQTNSMTLSFPAVINKEQGVEVGKGILEGLGKTLSEAFRLNDLAIGGLA